MTSKASSPNQQPPFGKLVINTLRRKIWISALYFVFLFFSLPVYAALTLQQYAHSSEPIINTSAIANTVTKILSYQNVAVAVIIGIGAIVTGLAIFSYMHSKRQVDFYHALPISRVKLFSVNYLAGIISMLIPLVINLLITLIIVAGYGMGGYIDVSLLLNSFVLSVVLFIAAFTTVALAVVFTGNGVISGLIALVLLAGGPAFVNLFMAVKYFFYATYYQAVYNWDNLMYYLSPVGSYFGLMEGTFTIGKTIAVSVVYIVILLILVLLLYRCRPSEAATKALAFAKSKPFFKYPIVLLAALVFAIIFHQSGDYSSGYFWWFFGAVCGSIILAQVIEIVYRFDFRGIRKGWIGLVIFIAVFCGFSAWMINSGKQYDAYLPPEDEVVGVNIYFSNVNSFVYNYNIGSDLYNNYNNYNHPNSLALTKDEWDYLNQGPVTSDDGIAAVISLTRKLIESHNSFNANLINRTDPDIQYPEPTKQAVDYTGTEYHTNTTSLSVVFTLADGTKVARQYSNYAQIDIADIIPELKIILNDQQYKKAQYDIFNFAPEQVRIEDIHSFEDYSYSDDKPSYLGIDSAVVAKFLDAYQSDMLAMDVSTQLTTMPVGMITLRCYNSDPGNVAVEGSVADYYRSVSYPVYGNFSATLTVLEQLGLTADYWQPRIDKITSINIYEYTNASNNEQPDVDIKKSQTYSGYQTVTDRTQIASLIGQTVNSQASPYNTLIDVDTSRQIIVNYVADNYGSNYQINRYYLLNK